MKRYKTHGPINEITKLSECMMIQDPKGLWVKWEDIPTWISVNDRLPDKDALYLIHAPSADEQKPVIHCAWYNPNNGAWSGLVDIWLKAITHWMPLPESPVL